MSVEIAQQLFKKWVFEPGTGFTCDFVHYPDTAQGVSNVAIRAYSDTFNQLSARNRLIITEQLSLLIKYIRALGVNCILEVANVSGKPSRPH